MSLAHPFALALAAALIDITLGYPETLRRRLGSPTDWLRAWHRLVRDSNEGGDPRVSLLIFLAPVAVLATFLVLMTSGPLGFLVQACLASTLVGRQNLDLRARAMAESWEAEGLPEALLAGEALGVDEKEPRFARAAAAAIAARYADEIASQTLFILLGGLIGAAVGRALNVAGWPLRAPGAFWLALATVCAPGPTAEATMLRALGDPPRDQPAYIRRALALYRRAAAIEIAALALLTLGAASLSV